MTLKEKEVERKVANKSKLIIFPSAACLDKIESLGAEVVVHGNVWDQADAHVKEMVKELGEDNACYVPPFEHPQELTTTGAASTRLKYSVIDYDADDGVGFPTYIGIPSVITYEILDVYYQKDQNLFKEDKCTVLKGGTNADCAALLRKER